VRPLIVDALASGRGKRLATRDVIGAGPRAVAGVLEKAGLSPRVALAETVLEGGLELGTHDLLLVSGMTSDLTAVRRVVSMWRAEADGPVLIGGPVASDPERALRKTRGDIAVIGEGELTLEELLEHGMARGQIPAEEDLSKIRGIAYPQDGEVRMKPLRPVMDRLTFERLEPSTRVIGDYPLHLSARVYVEVLRGCSNYHRARLALPEGACEGCGQCRGGSLEDRYYCPEGVPPGCGYCSVPSLFGPPKSRSVEKIAGEVEELLLMSTTIIWTLLLIHLNRAMVLL